MAELSYRDSVIGKAEDVEAPSEPMDPLALGFREYIFHINQLATDDLLNGTNTAAEFMKKYPFRMIGGAK